MSHPISIAALCVALTSVLAQAEEASYPLKTDAIRIRDPYIFAYAQDHVYLMYAETRNRDPRSSLGVEVYTSKDLVHWSQPKTVLTLPQDRGIEMVWSPEMHEYQGRYFLFTTLTMRDVLPADGVTRPAGWLKMHVRGTYVFVADCPYGPFKPFQEASHTPADWMALDGTLYVEDNQPYMVFCHEWVQLVDGTIDAMPLKADLSTPSGKPQRLFSASIAPGASTNPAAGKVTDGCFLYRSPRSGKLFMTWSTSLPGKEYCVVLAESESGKIAGPWNKQQLIYTQNGGHGMLFKSFDGRLLMPLHRPNNTPDERLHLFEIVDQGDTLTFGKEVDLRSE